MRWLFYFPKSRSRDGLLRRRPVWPRRLIRRSTTSYARRRFDHAEVGQLTYHVTLIVLLLFGCRIGSVVTMTMSESPWGLQETMQMRGVEPPVIPSGERIEQWRLVYKVVIDQKGRDVPFPTAPDSLIAAAYGIDFSGPQPIEPSQQLLADYTPPPLDAMNARQRYFAARLSEEPRMTVAIAADRRTPMDSVFALIQDARVAGIQRFVFMGREVSLLPR